MLAQCVFVYNRYFVIAIARTFALTVNVRAIKSLDHSTREISIILNYKQRLDL